jgi:voltage-gated potassium channel
VKRNLVEANQAYQSREVLALVGGIISIFAAGTLGYMIIEGWNFADSLFMTTITLSTIGYGEVHPLSATGRWFTIALVIGGVGVAGVAFSTFTALLVQRQSHWFSSKRKMREAIKSLKDHTIVCGYGRLSRIACPEMRLAGESLVILDKDEGRVQEALEAGFTALQGDCTLDEVLIDAGLKRAKRLVSLLPKDSDNLYVMLTSRELNPKLYTLSRAEDELGEKRLKRAGADSVIAPYRVGGLKIVDRLLRPYVTDFIDLTVTGSKGEYQIEEIKIPAMSRLHNVALKDSGLRQSTNVIIAAMLSESGELTFNPSGETLISQGGTLIAIGLKSDLAVLEKLLIEQNP